MTNDYKITRFRQANGAVMRAINIMREKYVALSTAQIVVEKWGFKKHEYIDAINYLCEKGYIRLRAITSHAETTLADADYRELEGKLTGLGINVLSGAKVDPDIDGSEI